MYPQPLSQISANFHHLSDSCWVHPTTFDAESPLANSSRAHIQFEGDLILDTDDVVVAAVGELAPPPSSPPPPPSPFYEHSRPRSTSEASTNARSAEMLRVKMLNCSSFTLTVSGSRPYYPYEISMMNATGMPGRNMTAFSYTIRECEMCECGFVQQGYTLALAPPLKPVEPPFEPPKAQQEEEEQQQQQAIMTRKRARTIHPAISFLADSAKRRRAVSVSVPGAASTLAPMEIDRSNLPDISTREPPAAVSNGADLTTLPGPVPASTGSPPPVPPGPEERDTDSRFRYLPRPPTPRPRRKSKSTPDELGNTEPHRPERKIAKFAVHPPRRYWPTQLGTFVQLTIQARIDVLVKNNVDGRMVILTLTGSTVAWLTVPK